MEIKYLGHSSFLLRTKDAKLVTDPFDASIGIPFPKTEADVVTVSHGHADHNNLKGISGEPLVISWAGEYERKGFRVSGFRWYHDDKKGEERGENVLFKIDVENMSILHCGDLGAVPPDDFIEDIGEVDILMVPVGGFYTVDPAGAAQMVKKTDPSIVIPMHYNNDKLKQDVFGKLSTVADFVKEMGVEMPPAVDKLTLKKDDISEDEMKVVVMTF